MDYEENGYNFYLRSETPYGEVVDLAIETSLSCKSELEVFLDVFERFLKASTFVLDGKHLELVDD